ncbi:MAG: TauD/TfdA family dioxygenase [Hyphomicrobiaceae bacterium]
MSEAGASIPEAAKQSTEFTAKQFDLADPKAYLVWREEKLAGYPQSAQDLRVNLTDLGQPTNGEKSSIVAMCRRASMAIYHTNVQSESAQTTADIRLSIRRFGAALGLGDTETHRSADDDGIVAIEVTQADTKRGFIPYTNKALSWHTDGYYNPVSAPIKGMLLHCVHPAAQGGINALLDPEIAYIRLRDKNPAMVAALMHPEAMTIPESLEDDGSVRTVSVGPVFFIDKLGRMTMRYTARTRSIHWREDADTLAAVALLNRLLAHEEEPLIIKYKLSANEGLISNNVLHARTAFENGESAARLLYRVRYKDRIGGT